MADGGDAEIVKLAAEIEKLLNKDADKDKKQAAAAKAAVAKLEGLKGVAQKAPD